MTFISTEIELLYEEYPRKQGWINIIAKIRLWYNWYKIPVIKWFNIVMWTMIIILIRKDKIMIWTLIKLSYEQRRLSIRDKVVFWIEINCHINDYQGKDTKLTEIRLIIITIEMNR